MIIYNNNTTTPFYIYLLAIIISTTQRHSNTHSISLYILPVVESMRGLLENVPWTCLPFSSLHLLLFLFLT